MWHANEAGREEGVSEASNHLYCWRCNRVARVTGSLGNSTLMIFYCHILGINNNTSCTTTKVLYIPPYTTSVS